jgi:hypothetical protein
MEREKPKRRIDLLSSAMSSLDVYNPKFIRDMAVGKDIE